MSFVTQKCHAGCLEDVRSNTPDFCPSGQQASAPQGNNEGNAMREARVAIPAAVLALPMEVAGITLSRVGKPSPAVCAHSGNL